MTDLPVNIGCLLGAFLLGSIPWGYLVGKIGGIDPRRVGSGNIGATNLGRVLGPVGFILVYLLDVASGFGAVFLLTPYFTWFLPANGVILGLLAIIGHIFTPWLAWKGGKGVATASGVTIALAPWAFVITFVFFLVFLFVTRIVSASSLIAAVVLPLSTLSLILCGAEADGNYWILGYAVLITIVVYFTHRRNIRRLWEGSEPRIGSTPKQET